jgi:hypothetical protein
MVGKRESESGTDSAGKIRERFEMVHTQLVQMLIEHGVKAYTRGGHIFALNIYSDIAGYVHEDWIRMRPSLKVVKAFLGY